MLPKQKRHEGTTEPQRLGVVVSFAHGITACSEEGDDRWIPDVGGCCVGLAMATEPRPTSQAVYCAASDPGHGSSCWSTVDVCRVDPNSTLHRRTPPASDPIWDRPIRADFFPRCNMEVTVNPGQASSPTGNGERIRGWEHEGLPVAFRAIDGSCECSRKPPAGNPENALQPAVPFVTFERGHEQCSLTVTTPSPLPRARGTRCMCVCALRSGRIRTDSTAWGEVPPPDAWHGPGGPRKELMYSPCLRHPHPNRRDHHHVLKRPKRQLPPPFHHSLPSIAPPPPPHSPESLRFTDVRPHSLMNLSRLLTRCTSLAGIACHVAPTP